MIAGHARHQLGSSREFLLASQLLGTRKNIAGIAVQFARHIVEQRAGIAGFISDSDPRLGERHLPRAEALGRTHADVGLLAIEKQIHPGFVVAAAQQRAERIERRAFDVARHRVVAPCIAYQLLGTQSVAAREQDPGERELAFGGERLLVLKITDDGAVVALVVPQRRFGPAA